MKIEQTLKEQTAKGLFWGGLSNGVQQILNLLFGIILARILNADDYGLVAMLAIFTSIAGIIQDSGFSTALINQKEIRHEDYNAVFWFTLFVSTTLYIGLFFSAPLIAEFYGKPELIKLARIVFLGFWFGGISIVPNALLLKQMMIKERAKIDIISLVISGIIGVVLALNDFAYIGIAIQTVTYVAIGALLRYYFTSWRPLLVINLRPLRKLLNFSFKLLLTNILLQVNNNVFSVILGKYYHEKQTGYYSQGQKWVGMGVLLINGMISSVAQPVFVQIKEDIDRQRNVFRKMVRFGAFISFPSMFGLAFISQEFIAILLGDKWLPSVPYLQLFCIWGAISFLWVLYTTLLMCYERSDTYLYGMILIGLLQLLVVFAMSSFGIYLMIVGYIFAYCLGILFWHYNVNKIIYIDFIHIVKDVLPYFFITIVSIVIAWCFTKNINNIYVSVLFKILITALVYVGLLWRLNSVIFMECLSFLRRKMNY